MYLDINKKIYNIEATNGYGKIAINNLSAGNYLANITFKENINFNKTFILKNFTILKANMTITCKINVKNRDATILFNISEKINEIGEININKTKFYVNITQGKGILILKDLEYGKHSFTINILNKNFNDLNKSYDFVINSIKTIIITKDITMYYDDSTIYFVCLKDINGVMLNNQLIKISIGRLTYYKKTNNEGIASIGLDLDPGSYNVDVYYNGNDKYKNSTVKNNIKVLSTI